MASPNKKAYLLRLHPEIYEALASWAEDEFRSVNAHMEYLLLDGLKRAGRKPSLRGKTKIIKKTDSPGENNNEASPASDNETSR